VKANLSAKLSELKDAVPGSSCHGDESAVITGIHYDSRKVNPGDLFVAVPGTRQDGAKFVPMAVEKGAAAVLAQKPVPGLPTLVAAPVRMAMGIIAGRLAGRPDLEMDPVAVTGTNGKTTVSYLIESVFKAAGLRPGVLGTINYRAGDEELPANTTTPESVDIFETLNWMKGKGADRVIMEVSSHALDQMRVSGLNIRKAVFTNLSREHLDYHSDLEDYFQAKKKLFCEVLSGKWREKAEEETPLAVVNLDDEHGIRLKEELEEEVRVIGYAVNNAAADIRARDVTTAMEGCRFVLHAKDLEVEVSSSLVGEHNVENILAAAALALGCGVSAHIVQKGVEALRKVPGRLEPVDNPYELTVLVDYAHTPDALEHAVMACANLARGRLITVFGCGGDRDTGKRPEMGKMAVSGSHLSVVTSDNPRTEDPRTIIEQIMAGINELGSKEMAPEELEKCGAMEKKNGSPGAFTVIPDRSMAIRAAIKAASPGDIVLIAGKGHEDYQILGTEKIHFDDREKARQFMEERSR